MWLYYFTFVLYIPMELENEETIFLLSLIILSSIESYAKDRYRIDYSLLENALSERNTYISIKENRIDSLRAMLGKLHNPEERLSIYDRIYDEYYTFSFDSAMHYVNLMTGLSARTRNRFYKSLATIHR